MKPEPSVWKSTLNEFDSQIAGGDAITGAVAVAAISAALAVSVLRMVLEVGTRKKESESDRKQLRALLEAANIESEHLRRAADEDRAAYAVYVQASRLPRASDQERAERLAAMRSALQQATETPLRAARSAAKSIELCAEAAAHVRGDIAADIGGAAAILSGAVHAILSSVDANLRRLDDGRLMGERRELEDRANHSAGQVRERLRT